MVILRWFTRRVCISTIAALFIAQWFLISRSFPFFTSMSNNTSNNTDEPQSSTKQLSQQAQQWTEERGRDLASAATWTNNQWTRFKDNAVNRILYQDDDSSLHNESGDGNGDDIEQIDGSESLRIAPDAEEVVVQVKEMDDGGEDPTYFPGESKFLLDMPDWIPDWLTSKTIHPSALWPPPQPSATTNTDTETQSEIERTTKRDDDNDQAEQKRDREQDQDQKRQKRPPILDVVYTWVNGSDPEWQYSRHIYEAKEPILQRINAAKIESRMVGRFRDNDELKHSVRSVYKFGKDVIRKIHISAADVIEEGLWETLQAEQRQEQEKGSGEADPIPSGAEAPQLFKRDRQDFDRWMEFARKHGANRTVAVKKGMEEGDKYIVADEEPTVRPLVLRQTRPGEEVGQVPSWLDRSSASRDKIDVAHHSTFFKNKDNLPVFCSVAIESQLYRIPNLSEVFIYMNDDEYFGMELAQSDFWTPHYGLVLQMTPATLIAPRPRDYDNVDPLDRGYLDNLQFTNYILSKRFGSRFRPILDHIVQVGSRSIFKEIESLWPVAFLQTEKSHFRTDYDGDTVSAMFLMAHYTIERLRETQLRSFWRYRVDSNANGDLEWEERWALFSLIEDWNASGGGVNRERTDQVIDHTSQFLSGYRQVLEQTGYGDTQNQPATRYVFSGMEGFPFLIPDANTSKTIHHEDWSEARALQKLNADLSVMPADRRCTFDVDFCLGPMFLERRGSLGKKDVEKVFKRMAFEEFHCGDCLLHIAMHSDRGVEYYLERVGDAEESDWGEYVPFVSRKLPAPIAAVDNNSTEGAGSSEENADNSETANNKDDANTDNAQNTENTENGDIQARSDDADNADNAVTTDTASETNTNTEKRDTIPFRTFSTKDTVVQKILKTQSQTHYTPHTPGISAILPHPFHHPKARLRIMRDLYRYNFVMGKSDSFFVTLVELENAQGDMAFLDKVKEHEKKLHIVCLNDGIIEERNGTEVRALLTEFLEDRYGDPAPWEKMTEDK